MPIIMIHSHVPKNPNDLAPMLTQIQDSGAKALNCPLNNVWVMFQPIHPEHYDRSLPPVVIIKAHTGRTPQMKEEFVKSVAANVGRGLSIEPEKIWIHYQETEPKDVWFEGHWGA